MSEGNSPNELYRKNWDLAFGPLPPESDAQQQTTNSSDNQSAEKSKTVVPSVIPQLHPNGREEPPSNPKRKHSPPDPWLKFWVQLALCIFTLGAFLAATYYANVASQQKDIMDGQWRALDAQWQTLRHQWATMSKTLGEIQKQTPRIIDSANAALGANGLAQQAIQIGQQAYITIGRSDGLVGELAIPSVPGADAIVTIYFQNNGHLPAKFNWGITANFPTFGGDPIVAMPAIRSPHVFHPMIRSRSKKDGSTSESGGVEIGGNSTYVADFGPVPRDRAERLQKGGEMFSVIGAFESCDELGTYSCRQFWITYQGVPTSRFRLDSSMDCPAFVYRLPPDTADTEYFPPCESRAQKERRMRAAQSH